MLCSGVLLVTWVRVDQLVELVEQGAERVPGRDDLAVRCRDDRLPPAGSGPDEAGMFIVEAPSGIDALRLPSRTVAAGPTCTAQVAAVRRCGQMGAV